MMELFLLLLLLPWSGGALLVDLSHSFDGRTINWNTQPPLALTNATTTPAAAGTRIWGRREEGMCAGTTHSGTHMDAPCHVTRGGWCVTDIPLRHLAGVEGVVVDIREVVRGDPDSHLRVRHLVEWERVHGRIPDGSLLLVCTGWSRFWPDRRRYLGTSGFDARRMRFPSISGEAAQWLSRHRSIVGVGIDSITIDVNNRREESHLALLTRNVYALENLNDLHLLPARGSRVFVLPTKLEGASGAPCRVVAEVPS